jgi:2-succinyl-5-enolpyruvyl-6-hydroxy-3-cyclohexene-1-carboxylate synthase
MRLSITFTLSSEQTELLKREWSKYNKILVVAGQHDYDNNLLSSLQTFTQTQPVAVVGDIISNINAVESVVRHTDVFLSHAPDDVKKSLRPDLLITFGKSVISKSLKLFLRNIHLKRTGIFSREAL